MAYVVSTRRFWSALCILIFMYATPVWANTLFQVKNIYPQSQRIIFSLPANPTTGYQWILKHYDQSVLLLKKQEYHVESNLVGAPGHMEWSFVQLVQQEPQTKNATTHNNITTIILEYKRPWESQVLINMKVRVFLKKTTAAQ